MAKEGYIIDRAGILRLQRTVEQQNLRIQSLERRLANVSVRRHESEWRPSAGGGARLVRANEAIAGSAYSDGELSVGDFNYADTIDGTNGDLDTAGATFEAYWCATSDAFAGVMGTLHVINGENYVMPLNSSLADQSSGSGNAKSFGRPHAAFKGGTPGLSSFAVSTSAAAIPMEDAMDNTALLYGAGFDYNVVTLTDDGMGDYYFNHVKHGSHIWMFSARGTGNVSITLGGYGVSSEYPATQTYMIDYGDLAESDAWAGSWTQFLATSPTQNLRIQAFTASGSGSVDYCFLTILPMFF